MHILIDNISLSKLEFTLYPENLDNQSYDLEIGCKSEFPKEDELVQTMRFDVTHLIENPAFDLSFIFIATYRSTGEGIPSLEDFAEFNGPAYIVPYARQLIADITAKSGSLDTIIIPPINIVASVGKGLHEVEQQDDPSEEEIEPVPE
jgi:preprotein translocase subunit SecB